MEDQQTNQEPQAEQVQAPPPMLVLNLNLNQVNGLLACLDEVPTKFNAWPLRQNIIQQASMQLEQLNQSDSLPPETVQ